MNESFIDSELLLPRAPLGTLKTLGYRWTYYRDTYNAKWQQLVFAEGFQIFDPATKWFEFAPETIKTYLPNGDEWYDSWQDNWLGNIWWTDGEVTGSLVSVDSPPRDLPWQQRWVRDYKNAPDDGSGVNKFVFGRITMLVCARMFALRQAINAELLLSLDNRGRPTVV